MRATANQAKAETEIAAPETDKLALAPKPAKAPAKRKKRAAAKPIEAAATSLAPVSNTSAQQERLSTGVWFISSSALGVLLIARAALSNIATNASDKYEPDHKAIAWIGDALQNNIVTHWLMTNYSGLAIVGCIVLGFGVANAKTWKKAFYYLVAECVGAGALLALAAIVTQFLWLFTVTVNGTALGREIFALLFFPAMIGLSMGRINTFRETQDWLRGVSVANYGEPQRPTTTLAHSQFADPASRQFNDIEIQ